jgi:hypothetical protein
MSKISGKEETHEFSSEAQMERFLDNQMHLEAEFERCNNDDDARPFGND